LAKPLNFKPEPLQIHSALQRELERAPSENTDALLNLYALLREAQDHGWLDAARGVIAGAPTAITEVAKYTNSEQSIALIRNLVSLGKILGSIDPEFLLKLSVAVEGHRDRKPSRSSVAALFGALFNRDMLRGAALMLAVVAILGKALAKPR
jgi:uncharacterized protein YjgD (DUF1641 family)